MKKGNVQDKEAENKFFSKIYSANSSNFNPDDSIVIDQISNILPTGGRILEAGCGMGHFGKVLAAKGYDCIGVDLSPQAIKKINRDGTSGSKYVVLEGDLENKDLFEPRTFDLILAPTILHHFPDFSNSRVINNLFYWLSDNGSCVIYEPNGTNCVNKMSSLLGSIFLKFYVYDIKTSNEKNHSFFDYKKFFETAGFSYVEGRSLTPAEPIEKNSKNSRLLRLMKGIRFVLYKLSNNILPFPFGGGILLLTFKKLKK